MKKPTKAVVESARKGTDEKWCNKLGKTTPFSLLNMSPEVYEECPFAPRHDTFTKV